MRASGFVFAAWIAACSSTTTKHPAELDNCVPIGDAACTGSGGASGSSTGGADAGIPDASADSAVGSGTCGDAGDGLTMNTACQPCVVASCCMAGGVCMRDCELILACIQTICQSGVDAGTDCVDQCKNTYPAGINAYSDFINCLNMNCLPECPMLPP